MARLIGQDIIEKLEVSRSLLSKQLSVGTERTVQ